MLVLVGQLWGYYCTKSNARNGIPREKKAKGRRVSGSVWTSVFSLIRVEGVIMLCC